MANGIDAGVGVSVDVGITVGVDVGITAAVRFDNVNVAVESKRCC